MKIIAISDLHGAQPKIPTCDILIVAGDTVGHNTPGQRFAFNQWLKNVRAKDKVVIAGNHDGLEFYDKREHIKGVHYLFNQTVEVQGLTIFGSPYTPPFQNWNYMPDDKTRYQAFMECPDDVDILVTHGPEYLILDKNFKGESCGDRMLSKALENKNPRVHIFGHIHEGYGYSDVTGMKSYNVSYVDQTYRNTRNPVEILLDIKKKKD